VALPFPAIVRWGRNGWQQIEEIPSVDTRLGFHVAVLDTAALSPGSRLDFTWRWQDGGEWAGHDIAVQIRGPETGGPIGPG
jgi:glucoamylase